MSIVPFVLVCIDDNVIVILNKCWLQTDGFSLQMHLEENFWRRK